MTRSVQKVWWFINVIPLTCDPMGTDWTTITLASVPPVRLSEDNDVWVGSWRLKIKCTDCEHEPNYDDIPRGSMTWSMIEPHALMINGEHKHKVRTVPPSNSSICRTINKFPEKATRLRAPPRGHLGPGPSHLSPIKIMPGFRIWFYLNNLILLFFLHNIKYKNQVAMGQFLDQDSWSFLHTARLCPINHCEKRIW